MAVELVSFNGLTRDGVGEGLFRHGFHQFARISFRVFPVLRGYISGAVAWPAVAARLEQLAGDDLREDEDQDAKNAGANARGARRVGREVAGCPGPSARRGSAPSLVA